MGILVLVRPVAVRTSVLRLWSTVIMVCVKVLMFSRVMVLILAMLVVMMPVRRLEVCRMTVRLWLMFSMLAFAWSSLLVMVTLK